MLEHNLFPPTIIFEKVILSSKSSQTDDVTKRKKKKKNKWIKFWFVSWEFKWLWLVARNIYLHFDGLREGEFFDEVGEMTVEGWAGGNCTKYLKRGVMKKWEKQKF